MSPSGARTPVIPPSGSGVTTLVSKNDLPPLNSVTPFPGIAKIFGPTSLQNNREVRVYICIYFSLISFLSFSIDVLETGIILYAKGINVNYFQNK